VDVHMGLDPPLPRPPEPNPLRVDVINGWPRSVFSDTSLGPECNFFNKQDPCNFVFLPLLPFTDVVVTDLSFVNVKF